MMKRNYTVFFLFLFIASITGGMAFNNVLDYSMIVGVGLALIFLLASAISLRKWNRGNNSNN
jgi:amino acid transporter